MLRRGLVRDYSSTISLITRVLDSLLVCASGAFAYFARFGTSSIPSIINYAVITFILALLAGLIFPLLSVYVSWRARGILAPAARVLLAWTLVCVLGLVLLFISHKTELYSRFWLGYWALFSAILLVGLRFAVYFYLQAIRRRGYNMRSVAIIGLNRHARTLSEQVQSADWSGLNIVGLFDTPENLAKVSDRDINVYSLEQLPAFIKTHQIEEIWVALPLEEGSKLREILDWLNTIPANIRYIPDLFGLSLLNHGITEIVGTPMIDLSATPMQGGYRLVKALEDRLLSGFILILISPLLALIALGVKLSSPGPIFFRQERLGWNGRPFQMLKFRSMPVDMEEKQGIHWGGAQKKQSTPFGALLRRTSLDELPQFINVLKGDMSIVGPRPERPVFVEQFKHEIPGYMQKHMVKAGITGWAQINGWRGDTDLKKRIEYDLYYIENWSLALDLRIIILTILFGLIHRNAY